MIVFSALSLQQEIESEFPLIKYKLIKSILMIYQTSSTNACHYDHLPPTKYSTPLDKDNTENETTITFYIAAATHITAATFIFF